MMVPEASNSREVVNPIHSTPGARIAIAYSRWIPILGCAAALLALGTTWYPRFEGGHDQKTELKAILGLRKSTELMWGQEDDDFGYPRHKVLRWSEKGVNIRDRVKQMAADLRAFDSHIAQQALLNAEYEQAVRAMTAQYKEDKKIVRLMLRNGLISESRRIDELESTAIQNVSYLESLVNSVRNGQATDDTSAAATIAALNASYNFLNASQELPQVDKRADEISKVF